MYKKIKNLINNKAVLTSIICIIFGMLYILYSYSNIKMNNGFENIKYNIFFWLISISLFIIIVSVIALILFKKELKIHILFILLASIFGIYYLIVAPIQNGSDEVAHFYRVFEVATGHLKTSTNDEGEYIERNVPNSFVEITNSEEKDYSIKIHDIKEKSLIELNKNENENRKANTAASVYSPVVYLPQAIGFAIGMALELKPLIILNIARIFGFIVWMIISSYAIKIAPSKKEFFLLLALLPTNITSAVTLSADTILNAFTLLLTTKILQIVSTNQKLNRKDIMILIICGIIIGQCKMAYLPIVLMCLVISKNKFENNKQYYIANLAIIVLSFLGTYIWMKIAAGDLYAEGTNEQKIWILNHPISYIIVIFRTILEYYSKLFYGVAAGNTLYQARVLLPSGISSALMACLIISVFIKETNIEVKTSKKIYTICIMGLMSLLTFTALYVSSTPIVTGQAGTRIIEGLQGRYFLPVIMLSVFLFNKKRVDIDEKSIYAISTMLQFAVILHTMQTFI